MKLINTLVSKMVGISILTLLVGSFGMNSAKADLMLRFTNDPGVDPNNVYVTVRRGLNGGPGTTGVVQDPSSIGQSITTDIPILSYATSPGGANPFTWTVMYNGQTNPDGSLSAAAGYGGLYSDSIQLSTIMQNGGLDFSSLNTPITGYSTVFFVSYGSGLINSTNYVNGDLGYNSSTDPNFNTKYTPVEVSYANASGDQGNTTAINYFSSELNLSTYANANATGTALQQKGWSQSTAQVYNTFTSNISTSVGGYATNTTNSADIVRVLGANSYLPNTLGPYTNFSSYLGDIKTNNARPQLQIGNNSTYSSGFTSGSQTASYTNAACVFLMSNTVSGTANSGYSLNETGNIVVTYTQFSTNSSSPTTPIPTNSYSVTYTNVSFNVTAVDTNSAANFIYGGNITSNSSFSGIGSTSFNQWVSDMANFTNGAGTLGSVTLESQIAGELSSAYLTGLAGSTNTNSSGQILGSLVSSNWWASSEPIGFGLAQTNPAYYAQYAGYIYNATTNTVYGSPYSDRFVNPTPLINVVNFNGTSVGSLLVDVGTPIGAVPEPSSLPLFGMGVLVGVYIIRRKLASHKN